MRLRVELFPADLDAFADFYVRVLGFGIVDDRRQDDVPYLAVQRANVRIGAVRTWQAVDPAHRAVPTGAELVLEVDDITLERDRVIASGWPLASDLTLQPWGLSDFRLFDPDGYYVRITTR
jgi:lactoylglutathione lyase